MRGMQSVSQHVITKIKILLYKTFSEYLIVNLTNTFHILMQRWLYVWFILPQQQSPTKFVCARLFGKFHFVRVTPSTGNDWDTVSCLLVLTECRSNINSSAVEGKPSTSKCQASSVFCDDNPKEVKQDIIDSVHYCLHLLEKGKYITDHVIVFHHAQRKWEVKWKKWPAWSKTSVLLKRRNCKQRKNDSIWKLTLRWRRLFKREN
jgi:hypothetical protein